MALPANNLLGTASDLSASIPMYGARARGVHDDNDGRLEQPSTYHCFGTSQDELHELHCYSDVCRQMTLLGKAWCIRPQSTECKLVEAGACVVRRRSGGLSAIVQQFRWMARLAIQSTRVSKALIESFRLRRVRRGRAAPPRL